MQTARGFQAELKSEAANTRKILDRIAEDKLGWKPHDKSMTLGRLSMHIAELPVWVIRAVEADSYDFAQHPYQATIPDSKKSVMEKFEEMLEKALTILEGVTEEQLQTKWKLLRGDHLIYELPRHVVIRMQLNHIIHHRGQLSVYLRLLEISVPGLYGPSADER